MNSPATTSISQLLRGAGLFDDLDDADLAKVAGVAAVEDRADGEILFKEGSWNANLYYVIAGAAALEMHVPRRGTKRILTVGAGQLLAWSALLGDGTMTATAVAQQGLRMVAIPADQLRSLCDSDHDIGYSVMQQTAKSLSRRLLATRLQLLDLFAESDSGTE
jgi:CRP/FNR family transcriptional regulator, cyclic AMP receptor protein